MNSQAFLLLPFRAFMLASEHECSNCDFNENSWKCGVKIASDHTLCKVELFSSHCYDFNCNWSRTVNQLTTSQRRLELQLRVWEVSAVTMGESYDESGDLCSFVLNISIAIVSASEWRNFSLKFASTSPLSRVQFWIQLAPWGDWLGRQCNTCNFCLTEIYRSCLWKLDNFLIK